MVHGVGDRHRAVGQRGEPLRLAEPGPVRRAVGEAALARADPPQHALAIGRQLHQLVAGGVRDQEGAAGQQQRLAGEAQLGGNRLRRYIRTVAAAQRALGGVLGLQLPHQGLDGVGVALAGVLGDHVALGVDDDEGGPGPHRVLLPGGQLRVVQDRVVHSVPLDGVHDGPVLGLVDELRRVHPDDHDGVAVLLLQLAQLVQDVQAVHTAERPEVEDDDAASQIREGEVFPAGVEPAAEAGQLGGADACTWSHIPIQHQLGGWHSPGPVRPARPGPSRSAARGSEDGRRRHEESRRSGPTIGLEALPSRAWAA